MSEIVWNYLMQVFNYFGIWLQLISFKVNCLQNSWFILAYSSADLAQNRKLWTHKMTENYYLQGQFSDVYSDGLLR